jgi:PAS domain S-box-containing protein
VWQVDQKGVYTYVSPQIRNLLGYAPEEVIGKTPFDLMPNDEAQRISEIFKFTATKKESIKNLENLNRHKDGRLVVLERRTLLRLMVTFRLSGRDRDILSGSL